jgi:hypothetical protein
LPDGRTLITLRDAASYIMGLPPKEEWQATAEALLLVVELGGPTMFARIGRHAGLEPRPRPRVQRDRENAPLGAEKAQDGPMKAYYFMALAGLIACAIAAMIFMEMTQQISPD